MLIGHYQAREQGSTPTSTPEPIGRSACSDAAQGVPTSQQPPLTLEELRQQSKTVYAAADEVYSKWSQLSEDVRSKQRELDAVLASMQGVQQPALSSSIKMYRDLLLQVGCFGPYSLVLLACWRCEWQDNIKACWHWGIFGITQYRELIKEEYQTSQALGSAWLADSNISQAIKVSYPCCACCTICTLNAAVGSLTSSGTCLAI